MNVYIVMESFAYDGEEIISIHSTKDGALQAGHAYAAQYSYTFDQETEVWKDFGSAIRIKEMPVQD